MVKIIDAKDIIGKPSEEELELELEPTENKIKPNKSSEKTPKNNYFKKILNNKKKSQTIIPTSDNKEFQNKKIKQKSSFAVKVDNILSKIVSVPVTEKIFFADNLRVMIKSGLSISEAIDTLAMQTGNQKFKRTLLEIKNGVVKGDTLGSMLENYPKIFPEFFTNMVKVGEMSGNLENNLEELAIQIKKDHDLVSKVKGAMIYPIVILIATGGIGALMFVYVIPSVLSIFEEINIELPFTTRMLISVSNAMTNHGLLIGIGFITLIILLISGGRTKKGKKLLHSIFLNVWIIGPIAKKVNLARFSRTLSSLLKTDIPVIESFKITSTVLSNIFYKNVCIRVSNELAKGITINSVLREYPKLFPPMVTQMVSVGEKSGTIDELLSEVANFYEREVEDTTKNLSSIIEPVLIVFLGSVVGFIAFAIISPIYTLSENI